jgi:hypothetical protein
LILAGWQASEEQVFTLCPEAGIVEANLLIAPMEQMILTIWLGAQVQRREQRLTI